MESTKNLSFLVVVISLVYFYMFRWSSMPSVVTTTELHDNYDYIVVGAGSAGSVVASRLSEDPDVTVLLLEAGGDYTVNDSYHIPLHFFELQKTNADWEYYTVPQKESHLGMLENRSYWPRGKLLGGSSIFNSMQYTRGSKHDYDEWADLGCKGWSYKDVLPYFLKSEDMRIDSLKNSKYHNVGGYIGVSTGGVTPIADVYLKAGEEMGYKLTDYNGEIQEGWSPMQLTIRNGVRSSTSLEYLGRAIGRQNLHVAIDALVSKIDIKGKEAKGIYFIKNGRKQYIKANKEIIISGGAVNSPQLLMLSGIGPKKHLEELNINVVADLPVGDNLQDHLLLHTYASMTEDIGITPEKIQSWKTQLQYKLFGTGILSIAGLDATSFFCTYDTKEKDCAADIQFMMYSVAMSDNFIILKDDVAKDFLFPKDSLGFTTVISLLDPKSVGTIRLKSADPFDYPLIDPQYLTDKRDIDAYVRAFRLWEKYLSTPSMKKIGASIDKMNLKICSQYEFRSDDYWICITKHLAYTVYHPAGTCKMGRKDDPTAVVDSELKVKGIKGLRVVDASIMPNVISGNTNAPVIMIAEKASDMIRGKYTVKEFKRSL
ncbi:glucose dehydrogenase [FAD, quinone]-like [Ruditapes philippinarum]|uniref:glucose dehydrogenase [FAD, quinone]-like n=1 Tax=Ruditapes philippinarum TaxID=129788 RepID=UPI00295BCA3C|nr:glucose dehydrogenase [FAD, quinone]-like [Ruditapes philippinarum]